MSMKTVAKTVMIAALMGASFSGVAFARDPVFTARLVAPVAAPTRVIAQNTLWNCEADTCVARSSQGATVRACRQFVREAGAPVAAYGTETTQLSSEELSLCNQYAAPQTQQARN